MPFDYPSHVNLDNLANEIANAVIQRYPIVDRDKQPTGRYPGYTPRDLYTAFPGQLGASLEAYMEQMVRIGFSQGTREVAALMMRYLQDNYASGVTQRMGAMMQTSAFDAQKVVVSEYEKNVEAVRKVQPYPRPGRLSGHLKKTLQSSAFFTASADGVSFGNEELLNSTARHWARLNYGAGAKGGIGQKATYSTGVEKILGEKGVAKHVNFRGAIFTNGYSSVGQARFEAFATRALSPGTRPAFEIPVGFWFGEGGGAPSPPKFSGSGSTEQFVPYSQAFAGLPSNIRGHKETPGIGKLNIQKKTLTAGIEPRRFLDAGVRALYVNVQNGVTGLVKDWLGSALERGPEYRRRLSEGDVVFTLDVKQS